VKSVITRFPSASIVALAGGLTLVTKADAGTRPTGDITSVEPDVDWNKYSTGNVNTVETPSPCNEIEMGTT
jgi:hypothetical protein